MTSDRPQPPESRPVQRSPRVLLVDDDPPVLRTLVRVLRQRCPSWHITAAENAFIAADLMRLENFDVLITDLSMPGATGRDLLEYAARISPSTLRIVHSAYLESHGGEETVAISDLVLKKPMRSEDFVNAIETAMRSSDLAIASRLNRLG